MSLLLEDKSTPALIIKPRIILVAHTDDLGWCITFNQQGQKFLSKPQQNFQQTKCYTRADPYRATDCITIDLKYQENFPTNTQVWTSLSHRNDRRQRGVILVSYVCYNSNLY